MRIGFDVRYISHALTGGVRTYVYNLARELPLVAPGDEFVYYADSKAPLELSEPAPNVTVRTLPWTSAVSTLINDRRIARWMDRDGVDLTHYPGNYGPEGRPPLVITLHDTLNLFPLREHLRGFGKRPRHVAMMAYLGRRTRQALRRADQIITTSEHARQDIARRSGFPIERIVAIHEAAGDEFRVITDQAALDQCRARFGLRGLVILADGIKNPGAAVDAYRALPQDVRNGADLVFFSREPAPRPPVAASLELPGIRFIPRPSTADLVLLMNVASVFLFPSWYEGFGIPLVEAMQCGLPVVASSRGSIPEVLGGAGLLFDVESPPELVAQLSAVLTSGTLREELRAKSLSRARDFSWQQTARRTLDVYRQVLAGLTPRR